MKNKSLQILSIAAFLCLTATVLNANQFSAIKSETELVSEPGGGCVPVITPSGSVDLCAGQSVTLSSSAGATYLWSNGQTTQDIIVSVAGDYSVTVFDGVSCTATSLITTVTEYSAIPGGINNFVGSTTGCPGNSLVYTVNPVLRAVYYEWTMPTGATSNGQTVYQTTSNSITVDFSAGFIAPGTIQLEVFNGCGVRGPAIKNVAPNPPLTPAPITGPTTACPSNTYTYSTPVVATVDTYTWTAPAGAIITGQGTNQVDITFPVGFISGHVRVVNSNQCGSSNQRSLLVRSTPPRPGDITGPTSGLCSSTQTYSIDPVLSATSYTWYAPTGSTVISGQGTTTAQISFNAGLNTGNVRVAANNVCGSSAIERLAVIGGIEITTEPVDVSVCTGALASFTVDAFGDSKIFQWRKDGIDLVDNGTITGSTTGTLTIDPTAISDNGTYDCIVRRSCGTADTSVGAILTVDDGPADPGAITGASVACDGDTGSPFSFALVPTATSYNWSGDAGVNIVSGQGTNAITVDFGTTPLSGYSLFVTSVNGCGESDTTTYWIRNKVSVPNFVSSPTTVCASANGVVYDVTPVGGATSYTWSVPANANIASGQGTNSITVNFGPAFVSGQVCVTASNICFTSAPRCKTVSAQPSTPGNIQGVTINVCNTSQNYTVNPIATATSYQWIAPTGATVSAGQGTNSVTVDFGPTFVSGDLQVVAQNVCGISGVRTRLIQAFPAKPAQVFGNASPCASSTGNVYNIDPVPGATSYVWTVPPGATVTAGQGTNTATVTFGTISGQLTAAAVNACGTGFSKGLAIAFSCRMQENPIAGVAANVYPNPVNELLNIEVESQLEEIVTLKIIDLSGRTVVSKHVQFTKGLSTVTLDVKNLTNGYYFVETQGSNSHTVNKFIKN